MNEYEHMSGDDIANEIADGATELQQRIFTLKENEALLVRRLSDLVNCISVGNNSKLQDIMTKSREALNDADTAKAAGVMSAEGVLLSILADSNKYPQLRVSELTSSRITRALKYLE